MTSRPDRSAAESRREKVFSSGIPFLADASRGSARTAKDGWCQRGVCPDIIKGDSIPIVHPLYRIAKGKTRRKLLKKS